METLPVTLIVKAPNQQIEDQTIQCEPSWTIHKLKQHLSEVYPSKPPKHEQKLIYSGKLLSDSVVLKDVLRQYEGQDTHTVHLVCSPKEGQPGSNNVEAPKNIPESSNNTSNQQEPVNQQQWYNQHQYNYNPQNMEQYTMHVLMMQQAYMHYMAQYMATQYGQRPQLPNMQLQQQNVPQQQVRDEAPVNAQPPQAAAAARDADRDRDWLDMFYMLSRVMIFISIVYFYSSPIRCIFVVLLGLGLYLYQIGFFRNVNINNNNIVQGETDEVQQPTRFMILWTFFTTFFASLIPEIPNVV